MKNQVIVGAMVVCVTMANVWAGFAEDMLVSAAGGLSAQQVRAHLQRGGVDVNGRDKSGETALTMAAYKGNVVVIPTLFDYGIDVNKPNAQGVTALMYAAQNGDLPLIDLLLKRHANPNARDHFGWTALTMVAKKAFEDVIGARTAYTGIITELLGHGADTNLHADGEKTALILAAQGGADAVVAALLDHGADVNVYTSGVTALTMAAQKGGAAVVKMLLEHGANVNARDVHGLTALMYAAARNKAGMVEALLAKPEIDVTIRDKQGKMARDYAKKNKDIKKLFDEHKKKQVAMAGQAAKLQALELDVIKLVGQKKFEQARKLLERNPELAGKSEKLARFKDLIHEELALVGRVPSTQRSKRVE